MATNTLLGVNSTRISKLSLDVLLTESLPLNAFLTDFSADVATAGEAVTTRFPSVLSVQNFNSSKSAQNVNTTARTITLDHYAGVPVEFSDREMALSDIELRELWIRPAITALFENVMANVFARVLAADYSANTVVTAANFNASAILGLASSMTEAKVPTTGRSMIVSPSYALSAKKDTAIQAQYAYGGTEAIREGRLPRVGGFEIYEWNGTIPTNSENLAGVALHRQALLIAGRPPALPRNWYGEVVNVSTPSGLTIQFRDYYDGSNQRSEWCWFFGTQKGVTGALHRIRSGS